MSISNVSARLSGIPIVSSINFKTSKNKVILVLGCIDLDCTLREPCIKAMIDQSSIYDQRFFER